MRVCRKCGNWFSPQRPGDKLCSICDPVVVPFPLPAPDLTDLREGYGDPA